jgi:hypothetical protein
MPRDRKLQIRELIRLEKELRLVEWESRRSERRLKQRLLAGAMMEPGRYYAEVRLRPEKDPASKNPDDYDLVISSVC